MNDNTDRDGGDLAERLLMDTICSLRGLASSSVRDPSLSIWSQGRSLHGDLLIESHAEPLIALVHAICSETQKPQVAQSILGAINSLLIGAFKVGQATERSLDQKQHENSIKTEAAREANPAASERQQRVRLISEFLQKDPNMNGSVKDLLGPINLMLVANGQRETEEWSLRRDLKKLKISKEGVDDGWSISDAFRPADE